MTPRMMFVLLILSVFLVACSKTEVVKIDTGSAEEPSTPKTTTEPNATTPSATEPIAPSTGGAAVAAEAGKTAKKCDDLDLNDPETVGKVIVTYTDGTTKDYYDTCTDIILTEYICEGKDVKSKNVICEKECFNVNVQNQASCPGCRVGFCVD
ncbi:hypothetical protein J4482_04260 [Candidatus Woesearchaeota archaeon]|nr:hypothetical protein [Candidatus Woesearchaeota archaeon]